MQSRTEYESKRNARESLGDVINQSNLSNSQEILLCKMHMMSAQCTCKQTDSGQIWIMGSPLFYSYKVQYDREPEPRPQRREDQSRIEKNVPHASGNLV